MSEALPAPGFTMQDAEHSTTVPTPQRLRERSVISVVALVAASVWLVASVVVGALVITSAPESDTVAASPPSLAAQANKQIYGGDAYTGIQNAAVDTEQAVVDGVNGLARFQLEVAEAQAAAAADHAGTIDLGVGFLIIGLGVLVFFVALQPFSRAR